MELSQRPKLPCPLFLINTSGIFCQEFSLGDFSILFLDYSAILLTHKNYGNERNPEGLVVQTCNAASLPLAESFANRDKHSQRLEMVSSILFLYGFPSPGVEVSFSGSFLLLLRGALARTRKEGYCVLSKKQE